MGVEAPETCWATHKCQAIYLWNCCIWLVNLFELYDDTRTWQRQSLNFCLCVCVCVCVCVFVWSVPHIRVLWTTMHKNKVQTSEIKTEQKELLVGCGEGTEENWDTTKDKIVPVQLRRLPGGSWLPFFCHLVVCRSQWPYSLRRQFAFWDRGFDSQGGRGNECLFVVSVVCCQGEVSESGLSLIQRSATNCVVSNEYAREAP